MKLQILIDQLDDQWNDDEKKKAHEKATNYLTKNKGSQFKKDQNVFCKLKVQKIAAENTKACS